MVSAGLTLALRLLRFTVLLHSQIPGELEPFEQLLRGRLCQADVRRALSPPTAGDGEEHFRSLGDERLLQLGGEHQVPEPEMLMGESREDAAADAEVGSPHVSAFLGVVKAKGEFPKVVRGHERCPFWQGCRLPQPTVSRPQPLHRGQHIRIAGQEPAAVGLFAVDREAITSESALFPADERGHGERVPAPRVGNLADDHDLFQLADAADPNLFDGRPRSWRRTHPARTPIGPG